MKEVVFYKETADIDQRVWDTLKNKQAMTIPRWADMKCIGGKVTITGNRFIKQQKLFTVKGKPNSLLYVKTARDGFCPLCVDGTLSNGRKWSELEIPEDYRRSDGGTRDGGHVTVMNIVDATRERILSGAKSAAWTGGPKT